MPLPRPWLVLCIGLMLAPSPAATAASGDLDLNLLALHWARGQYGSPVVCEVEGSPVRAVRRVLVAPSPASEGSHLVAARIQFPDPEAPGATRCFSELGAEEPRVEGALTILLPGRSRPDTARYDFDAAVRRDGGFRFEIRSGVLRVKGWGPGDAEPRSVDFAGGHAWLRIVRGGSDPERLLRSFSSPRKLTLDLDAPGGESLHFPLFQIGTR